MKIKHSDLATGYAYLIAVDRTEWVAMLTAMEITMKDLQRADRAGHLNTEDRRGLLALYTVMHATMEANRRACPDLQVQDQAIRTPGTGSPARVPTVQDWARSRLFVRSQNRQNQDND